MVCIKDELESLFDAAEKAVNALQYRLNQEAEVLIGTKYLRHPIGDYSDAAKSLDKQSFLSLLEADCERWQAEVDLELKK